MDGTLLWQKLVSPSAAESETVVTVLPDVTGDGSSDIFFASGQKAQVSRKHSAFGQLLVT